MKTRNLVAAALLLLVGTTSVALAMAGEYGKGDPKHPVGNSTWPAGTDLLANRADRIGGFWINANDTFFFAGDKKAFNNFLQQYAKVEGAHYLLLRAGDNHDAFAPKPLHGDQSDWELQAGYGMASVSLALNGRLALRDLRIPRNVQVDYEGTPNKEVAAFLARHKVIEPKTP